MGAFAACMAGLRAVGGDELIVDWVSSGRPLLGICVGHQILFEAGDEHGVHTTGVGVHAGAIGQLEADRLPHMGWNTVEPAAETRLFAGLAGERFYFVHSYAARPGGRPGESVTHHEGVPFVSAIERGNVSSTQFHPEKSGAAGLALLRNWLAS